MFALYSLSFIGMVAVTVVAQTNRNLPDTLSVAWYASWHAGTFPPSSVSWSKYTHMIYSFATTSSDPSTVGLADSDKALLPKFVSTAHKNGVKASLSIGGWGGSKYYSSNVGTAQSRSTFVKTITNLAKTYDLDGIDFDWEFPGKQGIGCNQVDENDTDNFLAFLQELRQDNVGKGLIISVPTFVFPFNGKDGQPSTNLTEFSKVLDYIAIMNYDIYNPKLRTATGPNAPLNDTCIPDEDRFGSAVSGVAAWYDAGIPLNQIVLGVPAYGHSFNVSSSALFKNGDRSQFELYTPFDAKHQPFGDKWDEPGGYNDLCGNPVGVGGVWDYWGLIDGGLLKSDGTAADGVPYYFDECSQTPFIYDEQKQALISYDDVQSFTIKGNFIKSNGLRGFAIWEAGGDYKDMLLDAIKGGIANATYTGYTGPQGKSSTSSSSGSSSQASSASSSVIVSKQFWLTNLIGFILWCISLS